MKKISRLIYLVVLLLISTLVFAQDKSSQSPIGNTMRSNGRIYVVIVVILTILAGLIIYLVRLDKKLRKLEKDISPD